MQVKLACTCKGGFSGAFCHLVDGNCHVDADGKCCPEPRALAHDGTCCLALESLDVDGRCCLEEDLDGCGVCNGRGYFIDRMGNCCPTGSQDANGACCLSSVDSCGALS
jgi:hypothetical protein